jgi:hypothetical protein
VDAGNDTEGVDSAQVMDASSSAAANDGRPIERLHCVASAHISDGGRRVDLLHAWDAGRQERATYKRIVIRDWHG